jgi:hypothetical protein
MFNPPGRGRHRDGLKRDGLSRDDLRSNFLSKCALCSDISVLKEMVVLGWSRRKSLIQDYLSRDSLNNENHRSGALGKLWTGITEVCLGRDGLAMIFKINYCLRRDN